MPSTKLVIGLTGGIGSGKSTVADLFVQRGAEIIDTDRISHDLTQPDQEAYLQIIAKFGRYLVMGNRHLNRKTLRKIIFADSADRKWLESLLHPLIRKELERRVEVSTAPYCIAVIPLLFENEPNPLLQRTLVVDAPEELQVSRTQARDMHTPEEVDAIMKTQVTRDIRLASANDVIVNDGKLDDIIPQVDKLHNYYLSLCGVETTSG
jgi:dephospho-CoA kinase